ncbi:MAG TPA: hypothetical protein PKC18_18580 [Lacipirellulaceae bacterium]|nr:hypothetical protein [Lacipirellulaceae bacterium]HMP06768.1 hypothetical protein [Lacipirellulaceae bacterium]
MPSRAQTSRGIFPSVAAGARRWTVAALVALLAPPGAAVRAADHGGHDGGGDHAAAAPTRTDILDLGEFRIRSSRSTDREIADAKFTLHLVLSTSATAEDVQRLLQWRHRLRDQVIIAVRSAAPADYLDPQLKRLHRLILFRVKRLAASNMVIGVYLTDFALDHGESIMEQYVPPVTPTAEPKKPAGGGHH